MTVTRTLRGFEGIDREVYASKTGEVSRLVQASSAIGAYEDAFDKPGSSYLWIGEHHHLSREEVTELVHHLLHWRRTGSLDVESEDE